MTHVITVTNILGSPFTESYICNIGFCLGQRAKVAVIELNQFPSLASFLLYQPHTYIDQIEEYKNLNESNEAICSKLGHTIHDVQFFFSNNKQDNYVSNTNSIIESLSEYYEYILFYISPYDLRLNECLSKSKTLITFDSIYPHQNVVVKSFKNEIKNMMPEIKIITALQQYPLHMKEKMNSDIENILIELRNEETVLIDSLINQKPYDRSSKLYASITKMIQNI